MTGVSEWGIRQVSRDRASLEIEGNYQRGRTSDNLKIFPAYAQPRLFPSEKAAQGAFTGGASSRLSVAKAEGFFRVGRVGGPVRRAGRTTPRKRGFVLLAMQPGPLPRAAAKVRESTTSSRISAFRGLVRRLLSEQIMLKQTSRSPPCCAAEDCRHFKHVLLSGMHGEQARSADQHDPFRQS